MNKQKLDRFRDAILESVKDSDIKSSDIGKADLDRAAEILYRGEETDPMEALIRVFHEKHEVTHEANSRMVCEGSPILDTQGKLGQNTRVERSRAESSKVGEGSFALVAWQREHGERGANHADLTHGLVFDQLIKAEPPRLPSLEGATEAGPNAASLAGTGPKIPILLALV